MYDERTPEQELQQLVAMYPEYDPHNPAAFHDPHDPDISAQPPPTRTT